MTKTAATPNNERGSAKRAAPGFRALAAPAALLCLAGLLAAAPARAQTGAKPEGAASEEETVDRVLTAAGTLAIVRDSPEDGLTLELRLDGRKVTVIDGTMYAGFVAHFRGLDDGEVVVMRVSDGGSGCPAVFRLVRVVDEARVSMTEEFGDCSDSPDITLKQLPGQELQFRFPGYYRLSASEEPGFRKPPPTTWVYKKGVLRELKPAAKRRD